MDVFSPEDLAFRDEVRAFVRENLPADIRARARQGFHSTKEDMRRWTEILHSRGWSCPGWPKEAGGPGWSATQRMIFDMVLFEEDAPVNTPFGPKMIGPVLIEYGTEAQKARYLPRILDGSEFWCQGYSEPGSGSDLASLRTRAVRDGDHYVVNGQKIWTSEAHFADMMFALVRTGTEGPKQAGITMLLIDMTSPGVERRPIITQDKSHYLNEVFFTDVRVPVENRIGEENKGWMYSTYLLKHERTAGASLGENKKDLRQLRELAQVMEQNGAPLAEDPAFDAEIARAEIDLAAHEMMARRVLEGAAGVDAGIGASMLKLRGVELKQRLSGLWMEALGPHAGVFYGPKAVSGNLDYGMEAAVGKTSQFLIRRAASIYGGTHEIQHGIIAKRGLGL